MTALVSPSCCSADNRRRDAGKAAQAWPVLGPTSWRCAEDTSLRPDERDSAEASDRSSDRVLGIATGIARCKFNVWRPPRGRAMSRNTRIIHGLAGSRTERSRYEMSRAMRVPEDGMAKKV
ncbi:hypothetical protein CERSUDRAFT_121760 [Gelatoporia subvermispora B]|uniref:Uncharacterized protein n=1 Tax=Ceriporiopsis subvermispora (strain B) TaxID=914234 RepID=M2PS77_CERS8|nr:hypothetical protein CERSUDRAFT_121760 [Gelatoporia subvermispora B]